MDKWILAFLGKVIRVSVMLMFINILFTCVFVFI